MPTITLPLKSMPAPRPSQGKHGYYYRGDYTDFKSTAVAMVRKQSAAFSSLDFDKPLTFEVILCGKLRGDLDNCLKAVLDICAEALNFSDTMQSVRHVSATYQPKDNDEIIITINQWR